MNLRDIKEDIGFLIGDFVEDCLMFAMLHPEKDLGQVEGLINEASDLADSLIDKVNHPAKDVKARAYYNRDGASLRFDIDGAQHTVPAASNAAPASPLSERLLLSGKRAL